VSYATRRDAEGQKIDNLADDNQSDVEATLKRFKRRNAAQKTHRTQASRLALCER
jgi:hypothetical protein